MVRRLDKKMADNYEKFLCFHFNIFACHLHRNWGCDFNAGLFKPWKCGIGSYLRLDQVLYDRLLYGFGIQLQYCVLLRQHSEIKVDKIQVFEWRHGIEEKRLLASYCHFRFAYANSSSCRALYNHRLLSFKQELRFS